MKDLYKRIGLASQTNNIDEIRKAIDHCDASYDIKESARHILLEAERKNVYDRNHKILKTIGKLRANMGLDRTSLWLAVHCQDFDAEPSTYDYPNQHYGTSPSTSEYENKNEENKSLINVCIFSAYGLFKNVFIFFVALLGPLFLRLIVIGITLGLFIFLAFIVDSCNHILISDTKYKPSASSYRDSPSAKNQSINQNTVNPPIYKPNMPSPVSFPPNGSVTRYHISEAIAPFEIKTRYGSGNYYVKLVDYNTKKIVLTVFVVEGMMAEIDVPLGSFELKYAVGKTWYGENYLFGPDTACSKADERFDFKAIGDQISGYTVELYLQTNGNLETNTIPVSEF